MEAVRIEIVPIRFLQSLGYDYAVKTISASPLPWGRLAFGFYQYIFCGRSVTKLPTKPYLHRTVEVRQCLPLAKLEGKVPPFGGG